MAVSATAAMAIAAGSPKPTKYRLHESIASIHQFALLRTILAITLSYHLLFSPETQLSSEARNYLVLFLLGSTAVLWRVPPRLFGRGWFIGTWVLSDTFLTTGIMYVAGQAAANLYVIFFLIILLAAFAPNFTQTIILSSFLCVGYGLTLYLQFEDVGSVSTGDLLRVPLLLVIAIFYGYAMELLRTERKQSWELRAERQKAEKALQLILDHANDALFYIESTGEILWCNQQAESVTGRPQASLAGRSIVTLLAPQSAALAEERLASSRRGESVPALAEMEVIRPDGGSAWVELNATTVRENQDQIRRLLVVRDITERRRMEQIKAKLEGQLRQSQKLEALGQLAGGIAHDFNNLLTVINGYGNLALAKLARDTTLYNDISMITQAGTRAMDLTRQLLVFSRRQVLDPKVMNLNAVLTEMDKMLRRLIREDVELTLVLGPSLDQIKADRGQIEQVIMNLVVNAGDAMPQGGRLTIETANAQLDEASADQVLAARPGPYVMLKVTDTGCGMDQETQSHIFEPFFTTKEVGKGTGLGLSTVYGIVKQSCGALSVSSALGRGTTFLVGLPRVEEALADTETLHMVIDQFRGSGTVLLVEDEEMVQALAARTLRDSGYTVLTAKNGREALTTCGEHHGPVHLVLTDVIMPGMGGDELARQLKVLYPEIKVLFMSGYASKVMDSDGIVKTGAALLQKPFSPADLARKVSELLRRG